MPDKDNKFHEFALKSILFKGQYDLYFCYVKSEKIAHVLALLQSRSTAVDAEHMAALVAGASRLPETIAHFAAGEMELAVVLADLFSILSAVRLSSAQHMITKENAQLIEGEYEQLVHRLAGGGRLSPFVTSQDFLLPAMPEAGELNSQSTQPSLVAGERAAKPPQLHIKDNK